jgi:hypothetical protein
MHPRGFFYALGCSFFDLSSVPPVSKLLLSQHRLPVGRLPLARCMIVEAWFTRYWVVILKQPIVSRYTSTNLNMKSIPIELTFAHKGSPGLLPFHRFSIRSLQQSWTNCELYRHPSLPCRLKFPDNFSYPRSMRCGKLTFLIKTLIPPLESLA